MPAHIQLEKAVRRMASCSVAASLLPVTSLRAPETAIYLHTPYAKAWDHSTISAHTHVTFITDAKAARI